jgi:MFS transporter, SP family, sugar:H+ symporter
LERFAQYRGGGEYKFSEVREGLVVGLLSLGCLVGAILAAPLSDRIGRRVPMLIGCAVFYVGNTIQIVAFHAWYQVSIGRFITGLAVGELSGTPPEMHLTKYSCQSINLSVYHDNFVAR